MNYVPPPPPKKKKKSYVKEQICNFYLSLAAHRTVGGGRSLRYTSMLLVCLFVLLVS